MLQVSCDWQILTGAWRIYPVAVIIAINLLIINMWVLVTMFSNMCSFCCWKRCLAWSIITKLHLHPFQSKNPKGSATLPLVPDSGDSCIEVYGRCCILKPNIYTCLWLLEKKMSPENETPHFREDVSRIFFSSNDWKGW